MLEDRLCPEAETAGAGGAASVASEGGVMERRGSGCLEVLVAYLFVAALFFSALTATDLTLGTRVSVAAAWPMMVVISTVRQLEDDVDAESARRAAEDESSREGGIKEVKP